MLTNEMVGCTIRASMAERFVEYVDQTLQRIMEASTPAGRQYWREITKEKDAESIALAKKCMQAFLVFERDKKTSPALRCMSLAQPQEIELVGTIGALLREGCDVQTKIQRTRHSANDPYMVVNQTIIIPDKQVHYHGSIRWNVASGDPIIITCARGMRHQMSDIYKEWLFFKQNPTDSTQVALDLCEHQVDDTRISYSRSSGIVNIQKDEYKIDPMDMLSFPKSGKSTRFYRYVDEYQDPHSQNGYKVWGNTSGLAR